MFRLDRRMVLSAASALLSSSLAGPSRAAELPEPVRLPSELANAVLDLEGRIALGRADADVTLIELFDYNCAFCRQSARDIRPLLAADKGLRIVLVNYAVLGELSIEASRLALAASRQKLRGGYLSVHETLFAVRGVVGAGRALRALTELGADRERLIRDADSDAVTAALINATRLGDSMGIAATPAYIIGNEAFTGVLTMAQKQAVIANFRRCERAVC
jgi:protein-disulfide isomerase